MYSPPLGTVGGGHQRGVGGVSRAMEGDSEVGGHADRVINMVASETMEHGLAFESVIILS